MLKNPMLKLAVAATLAAAALTAPAAAQESSALIDALVRKGILNDQEAEEIRADLSREVSQTPAGKINISNSLTELKLYGDIRLRYQYDNRDGQIQPTDASNDSDGSPSGQQRSRYRFRLRLNADFKLMENVFGGVELQTGLQSDSGNQTFQDGFADYPIFISKAYVGWTPTEWATVVIGKLPNPFYTTDLVWDADINPTGLTEQIAFHKLGLGGRADAAVSSGKGGYSKDGKSYAPSPVIDEERRWELTLIAGQFIFDDNFEGGGVFDPGDTDNDSTTDAFLFQTQLVGAYKFNPNLKVTIAPGWMVYNAASVTQSSAQRDVFGAFNENDFRDNALVSGATRNLSILLAPGEVAFKIGSVKTKLYWDFAYNIEGRKRVEEILDVIELINEDADEDRGIKADPDDRQATSIRDRIAWLAGIQLGENKKKGDWSLLANYRQTGIGAVDPNINESDFAAGELNTQGFKVGLAYSLTDFAVVAATYMHAFDLRDDLFGGQATGGNAIADANEIQVLQVDFNVKF